MSKHLLYLLLALMAIPSWLVAQDGERSRRARVSADIDRRAKHLYDKAIELMEYKQYDRGLEMLNSVVRDNQGTMLAHMAHMAIGKHYLDQRKYKECLSHFMLLTRLLAPVPGETQTEEEVELYNESLFQAGLAKLPVRTIRRRVPTFPQTYGSGWKDQVGKYGLLLHWYEPLQPQELE